MEKSWRQVKKLQIPPLQKEGGGQELKTNIKELTNLGTLQCDHKNPSEDTAGSSDRLARCAFLANSNMVATTIKNANTSTSSTTEKKEHTVPSSGSQCSAPTTQSDVSTPLPLVRQHLQSQGISSSATDIIMQSWRTSTRVQYSSYIKKWLEYCCKWQINPVSPPVASGLNFLAELYHKGLSYSALNTARSALASVIALQGNQSFGNHPLVSRFLKGTFTTRPALPKYREVWDVNTVLEHLKTLHPAESLSLKLLSLKLVMLLAILSGQRCQTIHALTTKDMKASNDRVMFIVNDLLKTTKPGKECTKVEFLSFDEDPRICVVRYLSEYLKRTQNLRHDHHKLLVSYQKPRRPVSKDTVSRWLKMELKLAGIDTSTFSAHSTRAASTSAAKAQKLSITTIMASDGWSSENTFTKYYNKTISKPIDNFGKQLLYALQK